MRASTALLALAAALSLGGCVTTTMVEVCFEEPLPQDVRPVEVVRAERLPSGELRLEVLHTGHGGVIAFDCPAAGGDARRVEAGETKGAGPPVAIVDDLAQGQGTRVERRAFGQRVRVADGAARFDVWLSPQRVDLPLWARITMFTVTLPASLALDLVTSPLQGLFWDPHDDDDDE